MGVVSVLTRPLILYPTPPGEVKILKQKLEDTLAEVQRLRSETTPPPPATPLSPHPEDSRPPWLRKTPLLRGQSLSPSLVPCVTQPWGGLCQLSSPVTWWGRSGDS